MSECNQVALISGVQNSDPLPSTSHSRENVFFFLSKRELVKISGKVAILGSFIIFFFGVCVCVVWNGMVYDDPENLWDEADGGEKSTGLEEMKRGKKNMI